MATDELGESSISKSHCWRRSERVLAIRSLSGFYVRRHQRVEVELPSFRPAPGHYAVALEFELAGVMVVHAAGYLQVVPA